MAILARRLGKTLLFVGLFFLSIRYVHTYPVRMPESQLDAWLSAANRLGIRDPDDLYIPVMLMIELIASIAAYVLVLRLWRFLAGRRLTR
ncbi:MAG: hypothetical protein RXR20_13580 [Paraburkholderia sp.]|jgi:hypothetical protein|uniref:hypothetical protein n=1 Tax=Burkholderiaceae TaxID=119060 RepID=UPI0010F9E5E1|nr:hypothetical protein [Burkholderia sp. 4M9327F10]